MPEFSRKIILDPAVVNHGGDRDFSIEAKPEERAALARRFGLDSLDRLSAKGRLRIEAGGRRAVLEARFTADLTQSCVVTLEPVTSRIAEGFTVVYEAGNAPGPGGQIDLDPMAEDPPEPLPGEGIDLGEAVAERLGLAIDPYPRAPGAAVAEAARADTPREGEGPDGGEASPFAALKSLKG